MSEDAKPAKKAAATKKTAGTKKGADVTTADVTEAIRTATETTTAKPALELGPKRVNPNRVEALDFTNTLDESKVIEPDSSRVSPITKLLRQYDAAIADGIVQANADGWFPLVKLAGYPTQESAVLARRRMAKANTDYDFALGEADGGVAVWARPNVTHAVYQTGG
jgi:hypothetical protein